MNSKESNWREEGGVIYIERDLTSDGTTGPEWIERLRKRGRRVDGYAESLLRSPDFKPTNGVTYRVTFLKGKLFSDVERISINVRDKASAGTFTKGQALAKPNAEVACLVCEILTNEDLQAMDLWSLNVMHDAIYDDEGYPCTLCVRSQREGEGLSLGAAQNKPSIRWPDENCGFGFISQAPSQS